MKVCARATAMKPRSALPSSMMWLLKARLRPDADEDALRDEITGGLSGGQPFAKDLLKALDTRPGETAPFYFPVEAKDPEHALGRAILEHVEVLGRTKVNQVDSGYGLDDDEGPSRRTVKPRPPARHRRASEEESD